MGHGLPGQGVRVRRPHHQDGARPHGQHLPTLALARARAPAPALALALALTLARCATSRATRNTSSATSRRPPSPSSPARTSTSSATSPRRWARCSSATSRHARRPRSLTQLPTTGPLTADLTCSLGMRRSRIRRRRTSEGFPDRPHKSVRCLSPSGNCPLRAPELNAKVAG